MTKAGTTVLFRSVASSFTRSVGVLQAWTGSSSTIATVVGTGGWAWGSSYAISITLVAANATIETRSSEAATIAPNPQQRLRRNPTWVSYLLFPVWCESRACGDAHP